MKKVLFGLIIGLVLGSAISVGATSKMFGKKVDSEFAIVVDGVTIDIRAIGIDGSSYIPLRAAGNLFGFDVDFIDWQVILNSKVEEEPPLMTEPFQKEMTQFEIDSWESMSIEDIEGWIKRHERYLDFWQGSITSYLLQDKLTEQEQISLKMQQENLALSLFYIDYLTDLKAQKEGK